MQHPNVLGTPLDGMVREGRCSGCLCRIGGSRTGAAIRKGTHPQLLANSLPPSTWSRCQSLYSGSADRYMDGLLPKCFRAAQSSCGLLDPPGVGLARPSAAATRKPLSNLLLLSLATLLHMEIPQRLPRGFIGGWHRLGCPETRAGSQLTSTLPFSSHSGGAYDECSCIWHADAHGDAGTSPADGRDDGRPHVPHPWGPPASRDAGKRRTGANFTTRWIKRDKPMGRGEGSPACR